MPCILSARDITSLYPEGTATIVTIAMNHVKKGSYPKEQSEIGEKPLWQNERQALALWLTAECERRSLRKLGMWLTEICNLLKTNLAFVDSW